MKIKEHLIVNTLVFAVLITLLYLGGCTQVVHSDDPNFEYPTNYWME